MTRAHALLASFPPSSYRLKYTARPPLKKGAWSARPAAAPCRGPRLACAIPRPRAVPALSRARDEARLTPSPQHAAAFAQLDLERLPGVGRSPLRL